jgi:hypothetical protein
LAPASFPWITPGQWDVFIPGESLFPLRRNFNPRCWGSLAARGRSGNAALAENRTEQGSRSRDPRRPVNGMTSTRAQKTIEVGLDPNPKGERRALGGATRDEWNDRLTTIVAAALPVNQQNTAVCSEAATEVFSGMLDIKPADPIEGVLVGQLIVAHEAALSMYRRAWQQPAEYFEGQDEISRARRQSGPDSGFAIGKTRPASRKGPATDHSEARHGERRSGSCC